MRKFLIHEKDIKLNKEKLDGILNERKIDYIELHDKVCRKFGLKLSYKGFMNALANRSSWKLLYAYAICDFLKINYNEIFEIVDVDVELEQKEREELKRRDIRNQK